MWTIVECKKCEGSGWKYCFECNNDAGMCEHDKLCSACRGTGYVPERAQGFTLIALQLSRIAELFPTKRAALEQLEYDYL